MENHRQMIVVSKQTMFKIFVEILPIISLFRAHSCTSFLTSPAVTKHHTIRQQDNPNPFSIHQSTIFHLAQSDSDDKENIDDKTSSDDEPTTTYSWEELQADPELSQLERQSSMQRKNVMLLPQRISAAVSVLAWTFVIGGVILNLLGYAYIRDPSGGIGVGTLNERDFQREVFRSKTAERPGDVMQPKLIDFTTEE